MGKFYSGNIRVTGNLARSQLTRCNSVFVYTFSKELVQGTCEKKVVPANRSKWRQNGPS